MSVSAAFQLAVGANRYRNPNYSSQRLRAEQEHTVQGPGREIPTMSVLFFVDFFLFASECVAADKGAACQPFLCAVRKCTRRGVREGDQYRS